MILAASLAVLVVSMGLSLAVGRYVIGPGELWTLLAGRFLDPQATFAPQAANVLYSVRLPRMLASVLVGGALALAGATYQGIFRNPLVSPDVLGVSQGATVGAASAILLGLGSAGIATAALVGGLLAVALTTAIPRLLRNDSTLMLVLAGVIVGGFATAVVGMLKYVADPEAQLAAITFWQLGSLADARSSGVERAAMLIVPAAVAAVLLR